MEELFDQLIDAVAEHLSGIADSDALDALMEKSSDLIQESLANLDDNVSALDETTFTQIVNNVVQSLGLDPTTAADNISTVAAIDGTAFTGHGIEENFTQIDLNTPGKLAPDESVVPQPHRKPWGGAFTGNCWDECQASVKDPGKRLTCGYHA